MKRFAFVAVLAVTPLPALANSNAAQFSCAVTNVCAIENHRQINCQPPINDLIFSMSVVHSAWITGTATITMDNVVTEYELHSTGHGGPPLKLIDDVQDTSGSTAGTASIAPWLAAVFAYSAIDGRELVRSVGWSDGRPDGVTLTFGNDGARTGYISACTCVGGASC